MKKQTLMQTLKASLCAVAVMSAASCSDDLVGSLSSNANLSQDYLSVVQSDNSRVTNYKAQSTRGAWTEDYQILSMPEQPEVSADAIVMDDYINAWNGTGNWYEGSVYVVPQGKTVDATVLVNGETIYVEGDLTISGWYAGSAPATIYVLPGGSATVKATIANLYDYDGTNNNYNPSFWSNSLTYMTVGDVDVTSAESTNIAHPFYCGGNLTANDLVLETDAYVGGNTTATSLICRSYQTSPYQYFGGEVHVGNMTLSGDPIVDIACKLIVDEKLYITSTYDPSGVYNAALYSQGYVKAATTELSTYAHIYLASGIMVDLGNLNMHNCETNGIVVKGESASVVVADNIIVNTDNTYNALQGFMGLHYNTMYNGDNRVENAEDCNLRSTIKVNEDDDTYIEESECIVGYGTKPTTPVVSYEEVADIENPDTDEDDEHSHALSNTSVYLAGNGMAYITYHKRGSEYGGCVEAMEIDKESETVELKSYAYSESQRDYNLCIVDEGAIYAVGGEKRGAFLARIELDAEGVFQSTCDTLSVVKLLGDNGVDANAIIRQGDSYVLAANGGTETLDAYDLSSTSKTLTAEGSYKHISADANHIVTLNLADKSSDESQVVVKIYDASDVTLESPVYEFTTEATITPVDGKNGVRIDGDRIYVCLGQNGLKCYDLSGNLEGEFKLNGGASCNAVEVDDNYVYVAYGEKGFYMLDKTLQTTLFKYRYTGGKSANYVAVDGQYVVIAYGESGLQVKKFTVEE